MPRRNQPQSLENLSLRTVAGNAVQACERSRGQHEEEIISQYVCSIPNILANDYVAEVLRLCSTLKKDFDITSAIHHKCTKILHRGYLSLSENWYRRLVSSLHVMSDLKVFENVSDDAEILPIEIFQSFPRLNKLCSIEIPTVSSQDLSILQNCPHLQEIDVNVACFWAEPDFSALANCSHLIKIRTSPFINPPSFAVLLLEKLPKLEVMTMSDVKDVLSLCQHPYPCLKDFGSKLNAKESDTLEKVPNYFPNLEQLAVKLAGEADLSPLNRLTNLKSLRVKGGTASSLLCLLDNCMSHLSSLTLDYVDGLDSVFGQDRNISFPQVNCLITFHCTGVNLAAIGEIFPNVKYLEAYANEFTALNLYPTAHAFQAIETFCVDVTMPRRYIRHILSRKNLKKLEMGNYSTDSFVSADLFQGIRLEALQTLMIYDNLLTKEVIPAILGSSGDDLQYVSLQSRWLTLSNGECDELSNQLQPYDMHFIIEDDSTIKFEYE